MGSLRFAWPDIGQRYIFNLSTAGLGTGTYALQFTVTGDPILHTVFFGVQ